MFHISRQLPFNALKFHVTHRSLRVMFFILAVAYALCGQAATECSEEYFSPDDYGNTVALERPHKEFTRKLRAARAEVSSGARSLAVAYEAGYLVCRCEEKANFWFRKAALAGDEIAKAWLEKHEALDSLRSGPECFDDYCFGNDKKELRIATLYAGQNGHYFAPVTINGVTIVGIIDTGASMIAMSEEAARRFGLAYQSGDKVAAMTANGKVVNATITVPSITVAGLTLRNVKVAVGITGNILIGMNFLGRVRMQMGAGRLVVEK